MQVQESLGRALTVSNDGSYKIGIQNDGQCQVPMARSKPCFSRRHSNVSMMLAQEEGNNVFCTNRVSGEPHAKEWRRQWRNGSNGVCMSEKSPSLPRTNAEDRSKRGHKAGRPARSTRSKQSQSSTEQTKTRKRKHDHNKLLSGAKPFRRERIGQDNSRQWICPADT